MLAPLIGLPTGPGYADRPAVAVSGFHKHELGWATNDRDTAGRTSIADVKLDSEIHFKFKLPLENGLLLDGRIELEGGGTTDYIDEIYMRVSGSFGRFILGSENAAAYLMHAMIRSVGISEGDADNWVTGKGGVFANGSGAGDSPLESSFLQMEDYDSDKITYFTPRLAGLQIGLSYIPNTTQDLNEAFASADDVYANGVSVGAQWRGGHAGLGLEIAGGWQTYRDVPAGAPKRPSGAVVSGRLSYGALTLGAAYMTIHGVRDGGGTEVTDSQDGEAVTVGVAYARGANEASLVFLAGRDAGGTAIAGSNRSRMVLAGVRRTVAPGVRIYGSLGYIRWTGELPGRADDNRGVLAVGDVRLDF